MRVDGACVQDKAEHQRGRDSGSDEDGEDDDTGRFSDGTII